MISEKKEEEILQRVEKVISYPNVIGYEVRNEEDNVVVFVEKKVPLEELDEGHVVPEEVMGYNISVEEIDVPEACISKNFSIGPRNRYSSGTLGCFFSPVFKVLERSRNKYYIPEKEYEKHNTFFSMFFENEKDYKMGLTNKHVVEEGTKVFHPSRPDDRVRKKGICVEDSVYSNSVDSSLVLFPIDSNFSINEKELGWSMKKPERGVSCVKQGRTTGKTKSKLDNTRTSVSIKYNEGNRFMRNVLRFDNNGNRFVRGGDSGSIVYEEDSKEVLGLIFAASRSFAFAIPIRKVLKEHDIIYEYIHNG